MNEVDQYRKIQRDTYESKWKSLVGVFFTFKGRNILKYIVVEGKTKATKSINFWEIRELPID